MDSGRARELIRFKETYITAFIDSDDAPTILNPEEIRDILRYNPNLRKSLAIYLTEWLEKKVQKAEEREASSRQPAAVQEETVSLAEYNAKLQEIEELKTTHAEALTELNTAHAEALSAHERQLSAMRRQQEVDRADQLLTSRNELCEQQKQTIDLLRQLSALREEKSALNDGNGKPEEDLEVLESQLTIYRSHPELLELTSTRNASNKPKPNTTSTKPEDSFPTPIPKKIQLYEFSIESPEQGERLVYKLRVENGKACLHNSTLSREMRSAAVDMSNLAKLIFEEIDGRNTPVGLFGSGGSGEVEEVGVSMASSKKMEAGQQVMAKKSNESKTVPSPFRFDYMGTLPVKEKEAITSPVKFGFMGPLPVDSEGAGGSAVAVDDGGTSTSTRAPKRRRDS